MAHIHPKAATSEPRRDAAMNNTPTTAAAPTVVLATKSPD
jgi:hypothetical protein